MAIPPLRAFQLWSRTLYEVRVCHSRLAFAFYSPYQFLLSADIDPLFDTGNPTFDELRRKIWEQVWECPRVTVEIEGTDWTGYWADKEWMYQTSLKIIGAAINVCDPYEAPLNFATFPDEIPPPC